MSTDTQRFERAYREIWAALHRSDDADLSQHERQLLHHVPTAGGAPLNELAQHLALPKSSASILVKNLEQRGFLKRNRDRDDERRLAIVLTKKGADRVAHDTVLEPTSLAAALKTLGSRERAALLATLEKLTQTLRE
jgi:DNA-binding MarR family transcriptional regulator